MTEKWIINDDGEVEDTTTHMTFDSFWELLTVLNGQSRHLNQLSEENRQLKQFQDRVFSWIDMHLQRLPTLRDDEFESDDEFADPSLYDGAIQILEAMKRELKGD